MSKIKLDNVTFNYTGQQDQSAVLKGINLSIQEGEFVSVIGPSGCGKSTLLSLLAGLALPTEGTISLEGQEIKGTGSDRGVVFQHYSLFPWMSAKKNIIFGLQQVSKIKNKKELEKVADDYLELVGLKGFGEKYPTQLSGGMQQRVAIARAFAMDAGILLMDEPFSAVDAKNRVELQELLLKLWDNGHEKKTVFFVTHDIDEAIILSDRIIVMSAETANIKKEIKVDFIRPRNRGTLIKSTAFADIRHKLVSLLYEEERDNEVAI